MDAETKKSPQSRRTVCDVAVIAWRPEQPGQFITVFSGDSLKFLRLKPASSLTLIKSCHTLGSLELFPILIMRCGNSFKS